LLQQFDAVTGKCQQFRFDLLGILGGHFASLFADPGAAWLHIRTLNDEG
jgi:hypothetical protein